jgi:large subunit ribosomal protein L6
VSVKIPDGVNVEVFEGRIVVSGPLGRIEKKFDPKTVRVERKENELVVSTGRKRNRRVQAMLNSVEAHLKNMIHGVENGFEKKLSCVFAHFPVTIEVKGHEVFIKNFLGERVPRKARIAEGAKVEVKGSEIVVKGIDKEAVGETAKNIVVTTKIKARDIRIFQDGIYYA